jgi:glycosyltransferase involved in cell wall biosynthesis
MPEVGVPGGPEGPGQSRVRLVRRNEWEVLSPPQPGAWQPTRTVSLIIPAHNCQQLLDLTLAGLSRQTYPAELFEVVVVDDGSEPKLEVPPLAPEHTRVVRALDHSTGWGRANALHVGATVSEGEILHWLDADLVAYPEHLAAQVRWHHVSPDAVTLGYKRFVPDGPWPTPEQVAAGPVDELFTDDRSEPHDYVEDLINATGGLRHADHLVFRAHVGATAALARELYREAGALRTDLRLGEDSELGYRLAQAGAVFIPEPGARSWHLGPSNMMLDGDRLRRYNRPYLAELMPHPRWLRGTAGRSWQVPLVTAVVTADGPLEVVRDCVDRLLASDEHDLMVLLVADWAGLDDGRRRVLDDPLLDRRLLAATYRSEPRVRLVGSTPESAFPSPYLLAVPHHLGVGPETVRRMVEELDAHRLGLLRLVPPGDGAGAAVPVLELWRTAAVSRARRHQQPGQSVAEVVDAVWGGRWAHGAEFGLVDLNPSDPAAGAAVALTGSGSGRGVRLALAGSGGRAGGGDPARPRAGWSGRGALDPAPEPVPVAGLRSWLRATGYVGRLAISRAWHHLTPSPRSFPRSYPRSSPRSSPRRSLRRSRSN